MTILKQPECDFWCVSLLAGWLISLIPTLAVFQKLNGYERELRQATTFDLVTFSLAKNSDDSRQIVDAWIRHGQLPTARKSLAIDYWFIPLYTLSFALAGACIFRCLGLTEQAWIVAAGLITALAVVAGTCDFAENKHLESLLTEKETDWQSAVDRGAVGIARLSAKAKFAILGLLTVVSLLGLVAAIIRWHRKPENRCNDPV